MLDTGSFVFVILIKPPKISEQRYLFLMSCASCEVVLGTDVADEESSVNCKQMFCQIPSLQGPL